MNESILDCKSEAALADPPFYLTVLLVFLDEEHHGLGKKCITHLRPSLPDDSRIRIMAWNIDRFSSPTCTMLATLDALEACLVVVAMPRNQGLSEDLSAWLLEWSSRKHASSGDLVAVLGGTTPRHATTWPEHPRMIEAAQKCGMQYSVFASRLPYPDADVCYSGSTRQIRSDAPLSPFAPAADLGRCRWSPDRVPPIQDLDELPARVGLYPIATDSSFA